MEKVVRRYVDDGYAVHLYVSLIMDASGAGNSVSARSFGQEDPAIEKMKPTELHEYIRSAVHSVGACLMCAEFPERPEPLPHLPENPGQLQQYPPSTTVDGKRLMNLWLRRERLWNVTLSVERHLDKKYDFLLWVPDSSLWIDKAARPSEILKDDFAKTTVWLRDCTTVGENNDHVVAFGRDAAPTMLTLYSSFLQGGLLEETVSCEEYLISAAMSRALWMNLSRFELFPEIDSMYYGDTHNLSTCIFGTYWCEGYTRESMGLKEEFCEAVERRMKSSENIGGNLMRGHGGRPF